jgi:hypothetical protein
VIGETLRWVGTQELFYIDYPQQFFVGSDHVDVHDDISIFGDSTELRKDPTNFGFRRETNEVLGRTTFPCHICAKHIVAAGIEKVVFLEPYPKSYAKELHWDSIEVEGDAVSGKVRFEPFVGISPFRYRDFFEKGKRKDDDGRVRQWKDGKPAPIVDIYKPIYTTLETLVSYARKLVTA